MRESGRFRHLVHELRYEQRTKYKIFKFLFYIVEHREWIKSVEDDSVETGIGRDSTTLRDANVQ